MGKRHKDNIYSGNTIRNDGKSVTVKLVSYNYSKSSLVKVMYTLHAVTWL